MSDQNDTNAKLLELEREFRETVVSELKGIKQSQTKLEVSIEKVDKKVELQIQKTEFELNNIFKTDAHQNQLLAEHIAGVNTLKELVQEHDRRDEERFRSLEAPSRLKIWLDTSLKMMGMLASVTGLLYGLISLVDKLLK